MILDLQNTIDIVNNRPNKNRIVKAQEQYTLLRMFCTGEGIDDYIEDNPEFMREGSRETLVNLMQSLGDVIHRVMSPMQKIYTAKGGSEYFNLPESAQNEFVLFLSKIAEGLPLNEWVRQIVQSEYLINPNGVILIEVNEDENPYPSIVNIMDIWEYLPNGRALEYLIIKVCDNDKNEYKAKGLLPKSVTSKSDVYRVIDDATDRLVLFEGKQKAIITSEVPNDFGYVPGMIISDIYGYTKSIRDSPLSCCINLMHTLLTNKGLFTWAYWRGAFPKEWMQMFECPTCHGEGLNSGSPCRECKGSGYIPFLRNADVIQVDWSKDELSKNIPNPPAGVIPSDIEALEFMRDNNWSLEQWMEYTIWGVKEITARGNSGPAGKAGGNVEVTAYEAQQNEQPRIDQLCIYGIWRVSVMTFVADCCGQFLYGAYYQGSAIIQGDRFLIESPDATIDRYAKLSNLANPAPMYVLDTLLQGLNDSMFAGNPLQYRKAELLRKVEPFVHEPVAVIWADPQLPLVSKLMKKYFDEWTNTLTADDIANTPDVGGVQILQQKLMEYVTGRYVMEKQMDTLLLDATGTVINIGDKVKTIWGKEKEPSQQGKLFTVMAIDGDSYSVGEDDDDNEDNLIQFTKGQLFRVPKGDNVLLNNQ